ncbi:hypothetical protein SAM19_04969 [Brevibacillus laterosporus]|nr:hypothetical protein [Brevibacillus laterosporus]
MIRLQEISTFCMQTDTWRFRIQNTTSSRRFAEKRILALNFFVYKILTQIQFLVLTFPVIYTFNCIINQNTTNIFSAGNSLFLILIFAGLLNYQANYETDSL